MKALAELRVFQTDVCSVRVDCCKCLHSVCCSRCTSGHTPFFGVDLCRPQIDCESAGAISGPDQLNCTGLVV